MYHGLSWDPKANRYLLEDQDAPRLGQRFDGVLFRCALFGSSYLVGQCRQVKEGVEFCLSGHFGVLALLDVHSVYKGASGQRAIRERRQALGRLRGQESLAEQQEVREMHRVGREEAALMRARAADRDRADVLEQARKDAKAGEKQREARRITAFGRQSLFGGGEAREGSW